MSKKHKKKSNKVHIPSRRDLSFWADLKLSFSDDYKDAKAAFAEFAGKSEKHRSERLLKLQTRVDAFFANKLKATPLLTVIFLIPLVFVMAVQPSIAATNALNAKKAAQKAYQEAQAATNVFHAPRDASSKIFKVYFNRHDMIHKVSLGYSSLPHPKTQKEFESLESFAKRFIGIKYTPGGKSPSEGFDCSGFVLYVIKNCGGKLRLGGSQEQYRYCANLPEGFEKPGDLIFFTGTTGLSSEGVASHVGIYLGEGQMIHASNSGIAVQDIHTEYWEKHFLGFGRPW